MEVFPFPQAPTRELAIWYPNLWIGIVALLFIEWLLVRAVESMTGNGSKNGRRREEDEK